MNYADVTAAGRPVEMLGTDSRATFITRTYAHVLGAILAFTGLEALLLNSPFGIALASRMLSVNWMWILGGFMVASWLATLAAHNARSLPMQYLGLGFFVVAQAIIFLPMLLMAQYMAVQRGSDVLAPAVLVTLMGFVGLTLTAFWTRKDFSFLGSLLRWAGIGALLLIVAGAIFGFQLGTFFSVGMVVFAGAAILYDTSNVLHHYPEDRYVGAALQLFASVAMMFWYILRIFMSRD